MRQFFQEYGSQLVSKTIEHFYISIIALLIAIVVAVPLGILLSKTKRIANVVLTIGCASNNSDVSSISHYDSNLWCR